MNSLTSYKPPAILTEREVRLAAVVSSRRHNVREAIGSVQTAVLVLKDKRGHAFNVDIKLPTADAEAVLALLLERDEQFLTSLNIELEI